jgi:hypothetical protein
MKQACHPSPYYTRYTGASAAFLAFKSLIYFYKNKGIGLGFLSRLGKGGVQCVMVSFNSDLPHFSSSFSKKKNIVSLGFI